jgi:hypothetical protein
MVLCRRQSIQHRRSQQQKISTQSGRMRSSIHYQQGAIALSSQCQISTEKHCKLAYNYNEACTLALNIAGAYSPGCQQSLDDVPHCVEDEGRVDHEALPHQFCSVDGTSWLDCRSNCMIEPNNRLRGAASRKVPRQLHSTVQHRDDNMWATLQSHWVPSKAAGNSRSDPISNGATPRVQLPGTQYTEATYRLQEMVPG